MKKLLFLMLTLSIFLNCSSQNYLDQATAQQLVNKEEFTFMAQKANPTNPDVINMANSMPSYGSSRMFDLDYGYTLELKNKEMNVTLPYFGRAYNANVYNTEKQSLRFTSKDYVLQKTLTKKGNYLLRIQPNDVSHIRIIIIEIYKNGKAFVSVDANDRQPISYDGYIMKNIEIKK